MMQTMRNSAKIVFIIVLVSFVGFMVYGGLVSLLSPQGGRGMSAPPGVIGKVNGHDISVEAFENKYRTAIRTVMEEDREPTQHE